MKTKFVCWQYCASPSAGSATSAAAAATASESSASGAGGSNGTSNSNAAKDVSAAAGRVERGVWVRAGETQEPCVDMVSVSAVDPDFSDAVRPARLAPRLAPLASLS